MLRVHVGSRSLLLMLACEFLIQPAPENTPGSTAVPSSPSSAVSQQQNSPILGSVFGQATGRHCSGTDIKKPSLQRKGGQLNRSSQFAQWPISPHLSALAQFRPFSLLGTSGASGTTSGARVDEIHRAAPSMAYSGWNLYTSLQIFDTKTDLRITCCPRPLFARRLAHRRARE